MLEDNITRAVNACERLLGDTDQIRKFFDYPFTKGGRVEHMIFGHNERVTLDECAESWNPFEVLRSTKKTVLRLAITRILAHDLT